MEQPLENKTLFTDLKQLIEQTRGRVASTVNSATTLMYWHIGERINRDVLNNERASYGKQIVSQVATQLQEHYGEKGFDIRNLRRMMQFAQNFPNVQIVAQAARQLSWSHFVEILPLKDELQLKTYKYNTQLFTGKFA